MDKYSALRIYPFNIVAKIPRKYYDNQTAFLEYRRHTKFGTIFGLILLEISTNCSEFCNHVPHFLYNKLVELGTQDL